MENNQRQHKDCEADAHQKVEQDHQLGARAQLLKIFPPDRNDLNSNNETCDDLCKLSLNEPKEPKSIPFTHTISYPWTVMVVSSYAMITGLAMLGSQGLLYVADCAVFVLDVELNFIIHIF